MMNKVALVTGAASNIGLAISQDLAKDHLVILADINNTEEIARAIGDNAHSVMADVSKHEDCQRLVEKAKEFGRLDVLVHAAGITRKTVPIEQIAINDWEDVIRVNLTGTFLLVQSAFDLLAKSSPSSVVLISSRAGQVGASAHGVNPAATKPHYVSSKAGVIALTKSFAIELAPKGVRVNCVAPGPIEGPMIPKEKWPEIMRHVPLGRLGKASEVAKAVRFLAGPDSEFITGHTLNINGGTYMQ